MIECRCGKYCVLNNVSNFPGELCMYLLAHTSQPASRVLGLKGKENKKKTYYRVGNRRCIKVKH